MAHREGKLNSNDYSEKKATGSRHSNQAEDSFKLAYKVGVEGFVQFSDVVSVSITWSKRKGNVAVD